MVEIIVFFLRTTITSTHAIKQYRIIVYVYRIDTRLDSKITTIDITIKSLLLNASENPLFLTLK